VVAYQHSITTDRKDQNNTLQGGSAIADHKKGDDKGVDIDMVGCTPARRDSRTYRSQRPVAPRGDESFVKVPHAEPLTRCRKR
jgi:hypothetical protein